MNDSTAMKIAMKIAKKSDHQHYKHSVLIVRGGKIIARGFNKGAKHAEISAIGVRNLRSPGYFRNASLYSFRFNRSGPANSRPCRNCERVLREVGIKTIYYFWWPSKFYTHAILCTENL